MNGQSLARALSLELAIAPPDRLASLFDVHHERLYRLARRLTPSKDDALDLVQETFLRAARSPQSIPVGAAPEEAWLVRVLINIRRDQWRKKSIRDRHHVNVDPAPSTPDPEAAVIAKNMVWQALNILPPRRRAVFVMHELDGLAIPAIAALLDVSAITVRWHLSVARRDLTGALKANRGDAI
jgi:RNA polymerase sigma-70 factor (ECF subfamily)